MFSISFESSDQTAAGRFVLRRFIGGDENLLVQAACRDSLSPTPRFSPMVFIGPSGTGKSLLAQGLLHQWAHHRSVPQDVAEWTGADFARSYANALETSSLEDFRRRLEHPRRLLIEDLQGLADKDAAQHELTRLIDIMSERGSVLLATLPALPAEVGGLTGALVSRLSGGLTVPISPPGAEARREITRQLCDFYRLQIGDEVLSLLCDGAPPPFPTARDLQHALSQLMLLSEQQRAPLDASLTQQLLEQESPERPTLRSICQLTAKHYQLKSSELRGASRRQNIVQARSMAMFLCRRLTDASFGQIGAYFGDRDHTTVLHACRQTEKRIASDLTIETDYTTLLHQLTS